MVSRIPARVAGALLLGAVPVSVLPVSGALAQQPLAIGQPMFIGPPSATGITRQDVERGVTVDSRQRRDYAPLGVRLGSFVLNGVLDVGPGFDSNLQGTKNNRKSDGFVDEAVSLNLDSNWTTHALGAFANMDARQYFSNSGFDWTDWEIGGYGRYDFNAFSNLEGRYRHIQDHLDVFSPDVQTAGVTRPVPYSSDEFTVNGNTRFNRVGLFGNGYYRTFRYEDITVNGVRNTLSQNDFDTVAGTIGTNYAFDEGRFATLQFRVQDVSYTQTISHPRDSFTWAVLAGFRYDFDGVWQANVNIGYQERTFQGPGIKPLNGPAVDAQVTWAPTLLTTVRFNVARTIEESIRQNAVSYTRTYGGVSVDHEFRRNIIFGGQFRIDYREYPSPSETALDGVFIASARYLINRSMSVLGTYSYIQRFQATGGFEEFDRNLVQVRLRIAL
jgi:hypothetical protein